MVAVVAVTVVVMVVLKTLTWIRVNAHHRIYRYPVVRKHCMIPVVIGAYAYGDEREVVVGQWQLNGKIWERAFEKKCEIF